MKKNMTICACVYWIICLLLYAGGVAMVIWWTPTEKMGEIQKIFYLHMPIAINTFLACMVTFIASIGYLWQRSRMWDDLAEASAQVAVLFATIVLMTGMIWARSEWGHWWTWSPRLTFSLVLWLLYVVYLVMRPAIDSSQRRALVCAVYGVVAFLDVPLVYLSVRLMPDMHPTSIELAYEMKLTLAFWFLPVSMTAAGLILGKYRLNRKRNKALIDQENESELTFSQSSSRSMA